MVKNNKILMINAIIIIIIIINNNINIIIININFTNYFGNFYVVLMTVEN